MLSFSVYRLGAILATVLLCFSLNLASQVPQLINFQAIARNPNTQQALSNQSIAGRFVIRTGSAQGPIIYAETFSAATNDFGVFTSRIGGNTSTTGVFATINWSASPAFLEVALDVNGGTNYEVVSSTQFVAVPYALSAESISNPGSINLNQLGDVNGTIPAVGQVLQWDGSQWTPVTVNAGVNGVDGKTILNGVVNPSAGLGTVGDFYINTAANTLFGPKTAGGWGSGVSLVGPAGATGPQGPAGANGTNGTNGLDGKSVLNGTSNPTAGQGVIGDFYINTSSNTIFGPKTAGGWGSGTSLIGPQGPAGPAANISGTTNFLPKFTTTTSLGNSRLIETTDRHGLNITNPSSRLHLHTTSSLTDFQITNSSSGSTATDGLAIYLTSSEAHINQQENSSLIFSTNGNPRMYINNVGNVGLGTATIPAESRLVVGALNTTNEGGQIQLNAPGGINTTAFFIDNFENRMRFMTGTNSGSGSPRMSINSAGNVGVGTELPQSKVHIVAGASNALEFEGGIKVSGAAANRPAFQITTPAVPNSTNYIQITGSEFPPSGYYLRLDNQFCNNDPNCLIYITAVGASAGSYSVVYNTITTGGLTANSWYIYSGTSFNFRKFNVLVVKS